MSWRDAVHAGLSLTLLALGGCQVFHTRVPRPERMLATEAESGAAPEPAADPSAPHDDEPDLFPMAETDDAEPEDDAPGEGARDLESSDTSGAPVASRYASLDRESCEAELGRRAIAFDHVNEARGVIAPLRLRGPLSGVTFRSSLPAAQRKMSSLEIYDCRLVLALDDFARVLAKHDVVEVVHLSVYRPVSTKVALKGAGRRHGGALAIDAAIFKTSDGRTMSVEKDFHGRIGARPCPAPTTASELRRIACEANEARLFNVLLTPDYNWAHRNHFHMEVTAGVKWTLVR